MLITTTSSVPGHEIVETFGLVRGTSIRTRHVLHDFVEWLRNLVGAELDHYLKMVGESREQALDRMRDHARRFGANAIIGVRFEMSRIAAGSAEMFVYGTAVRIQPRDADTRAPGYATDDDPAEE
ncbi:MAG: YbjQ family protein [Planctomycetes bacterium]|nr:YbjQ family protein [Planctomycetota bacterium]